MFQASRALLLYCAVDNEVETDVLRQAAHAQGKAVYYPRVLDRMRDIEFVRVAPGEALAPGAWGINEPTGEERFQAGQPALVIVPGIAFDLAGTRLGRGRGCYDRVLSSLHPPAHVLGLAFDLQVALSLPREAHDKPVEFIATESRVLRCDGAGASLSRAVGRLD